MWNETTQTMVSLRRSFSSFEDETESDFENFFCPLSSGEKYTCDERTFLVYKLSLTEMWVSH